MALLPVRHAWWLIAVASLLGTIEKATSGAFYGAISVGCIGVAATLLAPASSQRAESSRGVKLIAYLLLAISITVTAAQLAGALPR
jgi:hypothetical protein